MRAAGAKRTGQQRTVEIAVDGVPAPGWKRRLQRFCTRVLREAGADQWDLSLLLCDDPRMSDLNGRYRGKGGPTDVLSFPRERAIRPHGRSLAAAAVKGDVAISLDTMRRNAMDYGVSEDEELKRLVVHGILHCAGMDHGAGKGRGMLSLQRTLLSVLREERIIEE
ncbi:MAG TPA: rRNA maturation RNase YbeY [Spirochaetia bacterium]|nr:rRNA maturation RNase YbeY [Spirochaetia bacterium]